MKHRFSNKIPSPVVINKRDNSHYDPNISMESITSPMIRAMTPEDLDISTTTPPTSGFGSPPMNSSGLVDNHLVASLEQTYEEYAAEKKKWQDATNFFQKKKQDRTIQEIEGTIYNLVKKLKFFEHLTRDSVMEACKHFVYIKCSKHVTVADMSEWNSQYHHSRSSNRLNRGRSVVVGGGRTPSSPSNTHSTSDNFGISARSPSEPHSAISNEGNVMPKVHQAAHNESLSEALNSKFYVILSGTVGVIFIPNPEKSGMIGSFRRKGAQRKDSAASNGDEDTGAYSGMESGKRLCQLSRGDSFGEYNVNKCFEKEGRYLWVTREETELLELDIAVYNKVFREQHESEIESRVSFLKNLTVPIFKGYSNSSLYELSKALSLMVLPPRKAPQNTLLDKVIMKQNDKDCGRMFFLRKGECRMIKHLEFTETIGVKSRVAVKFLELATLKPKEYFGELGVILGEPRSTSVYTSTNSELLVLSKINFTRFLGNSIIEKMKEYAEGYPKDHELVQLYIKRKRWEAYKQQLIHEILRTEKNDYEMAGRRDDFFKQSGVVRVSMLRDKDDTKAEKGYQKPIGKTKKMKNKKDHLKELMEDKDMASFFSSQEFSNNGK